MKEPSLSIIVPIYNCAAFLEKTVAAILGADYRDIELILVDDGSTDGSGELIKSYLSDPRVKVLHKENGGAASARNAGLEIASGDFIGFCDCDDIPESDMYSYLMNEATNSGADIVQCACYVDYPDRSEIAHSAGARIFATSPGEMDVGFFDAFAFSTWSKIYKRELAKSVKYDTRYTIGEDLRYNLDALVKSKLTVLLPEPKYHYVQRDGSICYSAPSEKSLTSFRNMLKEASRDFRNYKKIRRFIFRENMKNNSDIYSKITLAGGFSELSREIRAEVRRSILRLAFTCGIPVKIKLKLTLIALAPRLYKRLLKKKKQGQ